MDPLNGCVEYPRQPALVARHHALVINLVRLSKQWISQKSPRLLEIGPGITVKIHLSLAICWPEPRITQNNNEVMEQASATDTGAGTSVFGRTRRTWPMSRVLAVAAGGTFWTFRGGLAPFSAGPRG
jgi:hypothetical protein